MIPLFIENFRTQFSYDKLVEQNFFKYQKSIDYKLTHKIERFCKNIRI